MNQTLYPRVNTDLNLEVVVEIPTPSSDIISLKSAKSNLSLESDKETENESKNLILKQLENSTSLFQWQKKILI